MKLFKYGEFITESHLQLLLEANISFKKDFSSVLKKINSPIAKKLIDVEGKEVDTNQNYIDINKDKSDFLNFKSDCLNISKPRSLDVSDVAIVVMLVA